MPTPSCPQCKQEIGGAATSTKLNPSREGFYVVGWCRLDVHEACYLLHLRSCRPCWTHNALLAGFETQEAP